LAKGEETTTVYFKLDVSGAAVRKHVIELQVFTPDEQLDFLGPRARAPIFVSRTAFDPIQKTFSTETDRGTVTVRVREVAADFNTLRRAVGRARDLFRRRPPGEPGKKPPCSPAEIDRLRQRLADFLAGKETDVCAIF